MAMSTLGHRTLPEHERHMTKRRFVIAITEFGTETLNGE
jgi:hypothetical protein